MTQTAKPLIVVFLLLIGNIISSSALANEENITNSIVKIIATHSHADYVSPWQPHGIHTVTGSGVVISGNRILTNAHVVADQTSLMVKRDSSGATYEAKVAHVCHTCDLALLTVANEAFFAGVKPLEIDGLPPLQSRVKVYGYPQGGQTISITAGIISRIEVDYYVHSGDSYLLIQVDAAINPGNSGGPAISNGKIVGIAMQTMPKGENIGYIVPPPIIKHFLKDVEDGHFDGFPQLDIYVQPVRNEALKKQYGLDKRRSGMLIIAVPQADNNISNFLQPGDVLLEIENHRIAEDGKVRLDHDLRVSANHLEYMKQANENLSVKILRQGKTHRYNIPLSVKQSRVDKVIFDQTPTYFVFAGLVFQPLTKGYVKSIKRPPYELASYIPEYTMEGYNMLVPSRMDISEKQVIILSQILPDAVNYGYNHMQSRVIHSVNGIAIENMEALINVVEKTKAPYITFLSDRGQVLTLQTEEAREKNQSILDKYRVHDDRSSDLR
ncbi:MAG: trypsin-like peptidase domain-containing protein [Gammaproteobacteria bacterium]|nr:trypsin-like peptidase domain-containing protein [Gammaproteobacteria bacterium]MDH5729594.1 trypsin-like peptidase domain-containing protein [Gammaproteobacteria bacterium]